MSANTRGARLRARAQGVGYRNRARAGLRLRGLVRGLALCLTLTGCAGPQVPALTASAPGFQQSPEERKLVARAVALDRELDEKGMLLDDPAVLGYIRATGQALVPPSAAGHVSFNFHVLRSPLVNAFALPNGSVYLTVGLLDRLESEAELAQVLGHEIAHVVLRHGLKVSESRRTSMVTAHIADLLLFGTSIAYLPYIASVASYSREQEDEADRFGLGAVAAQGYDPNAALSIFERMELVKKGESLDGSWYSSHPANAARRDALKALLREGKVTAPAATRDASRYRTQVASVAVDNIRLKLAGRQYESALDAATRNLADHPGSATLLAYKGEAYRHMADDPLGAAREHAWLYGKTYNDKLTAEFEQRRGEFRDAAHAAYVESLALEKALPLAQRGLGLVQLGRGEYKAARDSLALYLNHNPVVQDRDYITNLLKGIEP